MLFCTLELGRTKSHSDCPTTFTVTFTARGRCSCRRMRSAPSRPPPASIAGCHRTRRTSVVHLQVDSGPASSFRRAPTTLRLSNRIGWVGRPRCFSFGRWFVSKRGERNGPALSFSRGCHSRPRQGRRRRGRDRSRRTTISRYSVRRASTSPHTVRWHTMVTQIY